MKISLGQFAVKFNIGHDRIQKELSDAGFTNIPNKINDKLTDLQFGYLKDKFESDFVLKSEVELLIREDLKIIIKETSVLIKEFELLNVKIKRISNRYSASWKKDEIQSLITSFKEKLPQNLLDEIIKEDESFIEILKSPETKTKPSMEDAAKSLSENSDDYEPDAINYERIIMESLENGDADRFGF